MAKRERKYAAEYARRIRNATARGLTKSQARGHPGALQQSASALRSGPKPARLDWGLEGAIKSMRAGATLSDAAREAHVGRERLATYAKRYAGAVSKGGRWTFADNRARRVLVAAEGEPNFLVLKVPGFDPANLAGLHYAESLAVLDDRSLLPAFVERWSGVSIPDLKGQTHYFATDINALFRAHFGDEADWTRIYHIYMPS